MAQTVVSDAAGAAPSGGDGSTRDRILAVALEEFASRGFEATSTAAIARRAGVTQPLVHYHFNSKDELWRASVALAADGLEDAFGGLADELVGEPPHRQIEAVLRRYVRFCATHPELAQIVSHESVRGGERLDWLSQRGLQRGAGWLRQALAAAIDEGTVKDLPVASVLSSIGAAASYLFMARALAEGLYGVDTTDPAAVDAHVEAVVELFFHGMLTERGREGGDA